MVSEAKVLRQQKVVVGWWSQRRRRRQELQRTKDVCLCTLRRMLITRLEFLKDETSNAVLHGDYMVFTFV